MEQNNIFRLSANARTAPTKKPSERKGNIKAALKAAYEASQNSDEAGFMDAMEGAMGLAALED